MKELTAFRDQLIRVMHQNSRTSKGDNVTYSCDCGLSWTDTEENEGRLTSEFLLHVRLDSSPDVRFRMA